MQTGLKEKVVLVTGASRGIGKGIAAAFAAEGSSLVIISRQQEELEQVARELQQYDGQILPIAADVTRAGEAQRLVQAALDHFGSIHVLVNNVGGAAKLAPFEEITDEDWINIFQLNVLSTVRLIRAAAPVMQQQHWGRIINIASESATQPYPLMPHYTSSKAALVTLTKSLSKNYAGDGILVNTVSPALTRTPLIEQIFASQAREHGITPQEVEQGFVQGIALGRAGTPAEVGSAVVFLASEGASFITGANLRVDGGAIATI